MKTVLAFDSYKGCLSSSEVAAAAAGAVRAVYPDSEIVELPVADGGEGTVEALVSAMGGRIVMAEVSDPLGRPVAAGYGIAGNVAIMEVSSACGLTLLSPSERNPLAATTRGVGEMILDAVARGCSRFLIGLGGAFRAYLGAELVPGIDMVLDALDFDSIVGDADLVITGEGCSDSQTVKGKTPCGVLRRASRQGVKVALVSGEIRERDELSLLGFTQMIAATPCGMGLQEALRPEVAAENVRKAVLKLLKN